MIIRRNRLNALLVPLAIVISLTGYDNALAAVRGKTEEKTIKVNDPEVDISAVFQKEIADADGIYRLIDIQTEVIEPNDVPEKIVLTVEEPFLDVETGEERVPAETIEHEGMTFFLQTQEIRSAEVEERTIYGKEEIRFQDVEYIDQIPEKRPVTILDEFTGQQYRRSMPLSGYQTEREYWNDDFLFPIKIYSFDADYYMLGSLQIEKHADLGQYGDVFLQILNLDPEFYKVDSVMLSGEPYELDGEMVQEAIAYGSKKVLDVAAVYEGSITLAGVPTQYYECVYSTIRQEDGEGQEPYTIKAKAIYEEIIIGKPTKEEMPESYWARLAEFLTNPVTVTIAIFLLLLLVVSVLFRIGKRKRK